jgi:hypothetical protein
LYADCRVSKHGRTCVSEIAWLAFTVEWCFGRAGLGIGCWVRLRMAVRGAVEQQLEHGALVDSTLLQL